MKNFYRLLRPRIIIGEISCLVITVIYSFLRITYDGYVYYCDIGERRLWSGPIWTFIEEQLLGRIIIYAIFEFVLLCCFTFDHSIKKHVDNFERSYALVALFTGLLATFIGGVLFDLTHASCISGTINVFVILQMPVLGTIAIFEFLRWRINVGSIS